MPEATTNNGNGETKPTPAAEPFKIERSLMGVVNSYMEIAERVVTGSLGTKEAAEATRALNGVPAIVKTQLEAIKIFEKGSATARAQASRILDLGVTQALPNA